MTVRLVRLHSVRFILSAFVFVALGVGVDRLVLAQQTGIKRTILLTTDEPGSQSHEAVMGIAELEAAASSGRHRHPGVEIGYVLDGSIRVEHDGRAPMSLKGDTFKNDGVHNVTNTGAGQAKILAVYMVEKGKPLAENVR
jgi:quercetin dioxygenase-like cupin family protein